MPSHANAILAHYKSGNRKLIWKLPNLDMRMQCTIYIYMIFSVTYYLELCNVMIFYYASLFLIKKGCLDIVKH